MLMSMNLIQSFQINHRHRHHHHVTMQHKPQTMMSMIHQSKKNVNTIQQRYYDSTTTTSSSTSLQMSSEGNNDKSNNNNLPMLLDPGTKGGALFLSLVLFIVPIIIYEVVTLGLGIDGVEAGKWIGVGFTAFTTVLWVSTYIFRVATKDMTYVSWF